MPRRLLPQLLVAAAAISVALGCTLTRLSPPTRKLIQTNGTVDDVVHFVQCPDAVASPSATTFSHESSNNAVLLASDDPAASDVALERTTSDISPCTNVTATFSFDRFVGRVMYTLHARAPGSTMEGCKASVRFFVVGFTLFTENELPVSTRPDFLTGSTLANYTIVSGIAHALRLDYRVALANPSTVLHMLIQYADGTNSTTRTLSFSENAMEALTIEVSGDATSPVRHDVAQCVLNSPLVGLGTSQAGENCALAISSAPENSTTEAREGGDDLVLGVHLSKYKDGVVTILFVWDGLTAQDSELDDDLYTNVLTVDVGGDPPPVVEALHPRKRFRRTGGENITLVMDNVAMSSVRFLRVAGVTFPEVGGSFKKRDDGLFSATYVTQPGVGTDLEWRLYVSFPEGTTKTAKILDLSVEAFLSYVTDPLSVTSMSRSFGVVGDVVDLVGYFDGFDPNNGNHGLYMGTRRLGSIGVEPQVDEQGNTITFVIPERWLLGSSYVYDVRVTVGNETTSSVQFSYKPQGIRLEMEVYGASYDRESDIYKLGGCAISRFIASLPSGVVEPDRFDWQVVNHADESHKDLLPSFTNVATHSRILRLLPSVFGENEGRYQVSVSAEVNNETLHSSVTVHKIRRLLIGISLSRPQPRSISIPDVPLRVMAFVSPPRSECYNGSSVVIYRWTSGGRTETFSFRNFTQGLDTDIGTPARLGREFILPQHSLGVGETTVQVDAHMEDDDTITGSALTKFVIYPAPAVPLIGYGASRILHSVASDLLMTAEKSYNPDEKYLGNSSKISVYEWDCLIIPFIGNSSSTLPCDSDSMLRKTAGSFSVSREKLISLRSELALSDSQDPYFIRYSLKVGVNQTTSDVVYQTVEISQETRPVAKIEDLTLMDNRGEKFDRDHIRYYEDMLIVPDGFGLSWRFDLISPLTKALLFKEPGNLILHPGYFDPASSSLRQSLPLGLKAGALSPAEEYEVLISISSSSSGVERGEARIVFRTVDKPFLVLPELPIVYGDSETTFVAFARVTLDATQEFSYFFYLVNDDGDEFCIDGCSGKSIVQFRVTESGNYRIHVRLMDMLGKTLFEEATFPSNISVTGTAFEVSALSSSGIGVEEFGKVLSTAHAQGDHSTFELISSTLASRFRKRPLVAASEDENEILSLAVNAMHQIVQNSAPTTMTSKSYVKTASRFAGMRSEFFDSQETMYTVLSIVDKAISQVPSTEAFDLQEELLEFYNLSIRHVVSALSQSSSRVRLQQFGESSGLDARSLLVDMFTLFGEHLTTVLSRDSQCGMVKHLDTLVDGGIETGDVGKYTVGVQGLSKSVDEEAETFDIFSSYRNVNEKPSHSALTLAVMCNPDQAKGLRGETATFRWCDEVFTQSGVTAKSGEYKVDPGEKRVFTILETIDYVQLAGLSEDGSGTDTKFLVGTSVGVVRGTGVGRLELGEVAGCYSVNMSMSRLGVTPSRGCLSATGYAVGPGGKAFQAKIFLRDLRRNESAVVTNVSTDGSSTVVVTTSRPGVFGARGRDCPVSARKPTLALPDSQGEFGYALLAGAVGAIVGVVVVWVGTSSAYAQVSAAAAA